MSLLEQYWEDVNILETFKEDVNILETFKEAVTGLRSRNPRVAFEGRAAPVDIDKDVSVILPAASTSRTENTSKSVAKITPHQRVEIPQEAVNPEVVQKAQEQTLPSEVEQPESMIYEEMTVDATDQIHGVISEQEEVAEVMAEDRIPESDAATEEDQNQSSSSSDGTFDAQQLGVIDERDEDDEDDNSNASDGGQSTNVSTGRTRSHEQAFTTQTLGDEENQNSKDPYYYRCIHCGKYGAEKSMGQHSKNAHNIPEHCCFMCGQVSSSETAHRKHYEACKLMRRKKRSRLAEDKLLPKGRPRIRQFKPTKSNIFESSDENSRPIAARTVSKERDRRQGLRSTAPK